MLLRLCVTTLVVCAFVRADDWSWGADEEDPAPPAAEDLPKEEAVGRELPDGEVEVDPEIEGRFLGFKKPGFVEKIEDKLCKHGLGLGVSIVCCALFTLDTRRLTD